MGRPSHLRPVLLIDDSHEDLFFAKRLLIRAGITHPILTRHDGDEAIAFLRAAGRPDGGELLPFIIFCDVKMNGRSGFEVLGWARSEPKLKPVPFYMLSGADLEVDRQRAAELGATGYLVKFPLAAQFKQIITTADGG